MNQFDEIAPGFADAALDVAQVGNLRAHVEVQQGEPVEAAGLAHGLGQRQDLAGGQAELGALAAGVLPVARAQRGQAQANADFGGDAHAFGLAPDQRPFAGFFDHDHRLEPQLEPAQGQADVGGVLVAVADDQRAGPAHGQGGDQLRLAADLQAQPVDPGERAHDTGLLVDLDRVDQGVAPVVGLLVNGVLEGLAQLPGAGTQDVGEAQQHGQAQPVGAGALDDICQRQRLIAVGAGEQATCFVEVEVALRPAVDGVTAAGAGNRIIFHGRDCNGQLSEP